MFGPVIAERWNINQAIKRIINMPNDILVAAIKWHLKNSKPELKADTEFGIHQDLGSLEAAAQAAVTAVIRLYE